MKTEPTIEQRYNRTPRGRILRAYRDMSKRVRGNAMRPHHYAGKPLVAREVFYTWAWSDTEFHRLYAAWKRADFDSRLTPSVDRIDPSKGYVLGNMRWLTASQNKSLGASSSRTPTPIRQAIYKVAGVRFA